MRDGSEKKNVPKKKSTLIYTRVLKKKSTFFFLDGAIKYAGISCKNDSPKIWGV